MGKLLSDWDKIYLLHNIDMMSVRRIPPAPLRKSHWKLTAERNLSPQYPGRQAAFYLKAVSEVSLLVSRRLCPKMYRSAFLAPGLESKTGIVCYLCNLLGLQHIVGSLSSAPASRRSSTPATPE